MSLSTKVLIGLAAGVATGLVLGELAAPLAVVGHAVILALQVTVLPFMVVALVSGLGHLDGRTALAIARSGGSALAILWVNVMAAVLAFPVSFPDWESASFFSRSLTGPPASAPGASAPAGRSWMAARRPAEGFSPRTASLDATARHQCFVPGSWSLAGPWGLVVGAVSPTRGYAATDEPSGDRPPRRATRDQNPSPNRTFRPATCGWRRAALLSRHAAHARGVGSPAVT